MDKTPNPIGWPWLRTPAATRLIDRLWPEEIAEREQRERNQQIVTAEIQAYLDRKDASRG
jgi:hypothetical protein